MSIEKPRPKLLINDHIYTAGNPGIIQKYGIDGELLWEYQLERDSVVSGLQVSDLGQVFASLIEYDPANNPSNERLCSLDAKGSLLWEQDNSQNIRGMVHDGGSRLYVCSNKGLTALDNEGQVVWTALPNEPNLNNVILGSSDNIVCSISDSEIVLVDTMGNILWRKSIQTGSPSNGMTCRWSLCEHNGVIYISASEIHLPSNLLSILLLMKSSKRLEDYAMKGRLFAIEASSGLTQWEWKTNSIPRQALKFGPNGEIYAVCFDGYLYSLRP